MSTNTLEKCTSQNTLKNANGFGKIERGSLERCNVGGLGVKDKPQPQTKTDAWFAYMLPSSAYNVLGLWSLSVF